MVAGIYLFALNVAMVYEYDDGIRRSYLEVEVSTHIYIDTSRDSDPS